MKTPGCDIKTFIDRVEHQAPAPSGKILLRGHEVGRIHVFDSLVTPEPVEGHRWLELGPGPNLGSVRWKLEKIDPAADARLRRMAAGLFPGPGVPFFPHPWT